MLAPAGIADRLAADTLGMQALKKHAGPPQVFLAPPRGAGWAQPGPGGGLESRAAGDDPEALRAAARQFEAMLLQTLLKEMRETSWRAADDPFAPSESLKLYRELLDQQWVQRMVQGRGLGFAEKMAEQMLKGHSSGEAAITPPPQAAGRMTPQPEIGPVVDAGRSERAQQTPQATGATEAYGAGATDPGMRRARFVQTMRPHAEAAARTTGLPADFILAHAALESGWGAREIRGQDGRPSHNLFGIKAGASWNGASIEAQTTEYRHGLPVKQIDRFRAYDDYTQAFGDYATLLINRYGNAVRAGADADTFAQALAAGGYATDPAYAGKLRGVIASVARMNA